MRGIFEKVKGSGVYWIRWTDHKGQLHREKGGRKSDSIRLLEKRRTETLQNKKLPELNPARRITFRDIVADALEHSKAHNGERSTREFELKLPAMLEAFGDRPADEITKQDITRWLVVQGDDREWAAATRNRWQAAFSLCFRVAVDNEKLEKNPAARIKRKTENNERVRFLSRDEEARLRQAIFDGCRNPTAYLAALDIALMTGMRMSEQFSLKWSQVEFDTKTVHLPVTKNGKPHTVRLNAKALDAFQTLRALSKGSVVVFPTGDGTAVKTTRAWFDPAVERAGIQGVTWHVLRHTFASRLVMAGVSLNTVGELMNHKTVQMTKRYAHLSPDHKSAALDHLLVSSTDTRTDTGALSGNQQGI
jgi:integrase